MNLDKPITS